ncbi:VOC family protein [Fimbriiglobus ruber]|uniref:Glyoxalase family protein n=1 Tax=Fimbriiglobus ruber TaxID=1908690 RepID=A0A225D4S3_9BACT|nr:VOC family protein [Fimbriiglobus ruber]OWK36601.1 Glyoxalase family protein [Fimbriiglobus ruber]
MSVKPIPDGYHTVTPYLYVHDTAAAIDFYVKAFGATEVMRMPGPGGSVVHAEIQIGTSRVMMADENPEWGNKSPRTLGGTSAGYCLYVEDADAVFARAVAAGATVKRPMADQFYGDRSGTVTDPFGQMWTIATHTEDLSPEEMQARMDAMMKGQPG